MKKPMGRKKKKSGKKRLDGKGAFEKIHEIVRRIPPGRVMTYGDISAFLGYTLSPLAVGWALHNCPQDVPWQRVVNASGGFSTDRSAGTPRGKQKALLESEGIVFNAAGRVDLDRYGWAPPGPV